MTMNTRLRFEAIQACLDSPCAFRIENNDYENIIWVETPSRVPTDDEVTAKQNELIAAADAVAYREERAAEYPPVTDFIDAYVWQTQGNDKPMQDYVSKCMAVKAQYPKP